MNKHFIARCKTVQTGSETLFQFFCDLSGALVCTVKHADTPEDAWEETARQHFSQCRKCGRWVSDPMYNAETLQCVQCSPWEETPAFCPQCGERVMDDDMFCHHCNARLKYSETEGCG